MQFVGDRNETYSDQVTGNEQYPTLLLSDFQKQFSFLTATPEASAVVALTMSAMDVQKQLRHYYGDEPDLGAMSMAEYGSGDFWVVLYIHAVFCKAAAALLGGRLGTDATKTAADRQATLNDEQNHLLMQYRDAVDKLMAGSSGITVKLI